MSAIFGRINFNGQPISAETVGILSEKMSMWGPQGIEILSRIDFFLGYACQSFDYESKYAKMPLENRNSGQAMTASARLDNRAELLKIFGISFPESFHVSDEKLLFLSFEKWGKETPAKLRGDWAFAHWDYRQKKLFLARDQIGNTGLFYTYQQGCFIFSTDLAMIAEMPGFKCQLDEEVLAKHLSFHSPSPEKTIWRNIFYLLPAHFLQADSSDFKTTKYWDIQSVESLKLNSPDEYFERFRVLFKAAVNRRMSSSKPIGTQLSSGLDSSAVTALAAEQALAQGRKIYAFTSVPIFPADHLAPGTIANEWAIAHTLVDKYPNIEHIPIRADDISPIKALRENVKIHKTPFSAIGNYYWAYSLHLTAQKLGIANMLTGQQGNGGISWNGGRDRIFCLFHQGKWTEGLRSLKKTCSFENIGWYRAFKAHILRPLLKPSIDGFTAFFSKKKYPEEGFSAINPAFSRKMDLPQKIPKFERNGFLSPDEERERTITPNAIVGGPIHQKIGAFFKMGIWDPTVDLDLLEFCLAVPNKIFNYSGGNRMLIRQGMEGILPPEIQWNPKRGKQAVDIVPRLLLKPNEVEDEIFRISQSNAAIEYLDFTAIKVAWDKIKKSQGNLPHSSEVLLLLRGLQIGIFLEQLVD
ncbi:MAG: asparagine synthase [Candidatus Riflebacteria bacterium]|nr:asparagine synthase [Candidatus Riflebacteria bacterium]